MRIVSSGVPTMIPIHSMASENSTTTLMPFRGFVIGLQIPNIPSTLPSLTIWKNEVNVTEHVMRSSQVSDNFIKECETEDIFAAMNAIEKLKGEMPLPAIIPAKVSAAFSELIPDRS